MSGNWDNNDGLRVKFGTTESASGAGGSPLTFGNLSVIEVEIDATALTATPGTVFEDHVVIPSGSVIHKVEVIAETACTSAGAATLDIGLIKLDRTTELDYNGLVAAMAKTAIDATGETNELIVGSTGAGALVGTVLASPGVLTINYNTAAFTAGHLVIRVYHYAP